MEEKLKRIESEALRAIEEARDIDRLKELHIKYLGRKGAIGELMRQMGTVPQNERPRFGKLANALKERVAEALQSKEASLSKVEKAEAKVDLTLPGVMRELGRRHPITQVIDQINDIFLRLGFRIVEGPEIETEYYNFEALNIPPDHPSRETFDTFYIEDDILLRSQTSTVQIRVMEKEKPPLKIVASGKVYRPDAVDASHSFMFHQVEGLMVDKKVSFSELKGVLMAFASEMFGPNTRLRFRPHYFPFTEPSAEVDISCIICGGKGCRVCSHKGWLEILGAGMVDPAVFEAVKYDPEEYTGFAFGMGVERIAMLKWGIDDIRLFFENDIRFLKQF